MTRRRWTLTVVVRDDEARVKGWRGGELLDSIGVRAVWIGGTLRHWVISSKDAPDFIAAAEHAGAYVKVIDERTKADAPPVRDPEQLTLFAAGGAA